MSESVFIDIATQAIQVALMIALPLLGVSLVTGLLISLFQVTTSIQDVTLTFVPKIIAVGLTLVVAGHWMLRNLLSFMQQLFGDLTQVIG